MLLQWNLNHALGLTSAALIVGVGAFVIAARPHAGVARAFFLFALFDGLSTACFELRDMSVDASDQVFFYSTYYYFYVASIVLLFGFGLVFPRPVVPPHWRAPLVGVLSALAIGTLGLFALDHGVFWNYVVRGDRVAFPRAPGGELVGLAFGVTVAFVTVKLARDFVSGPGEGHRRQAAFVLAGLLIGYGSVRVASLTTNLARGGALFRSPNPFTQLLVWSYVAVALAIAYAVVIVARRCRDMPRERRAVLASGGVVAGLAAVALVAPGASALVQIVGLVIYPVLLAWAILRYSVFDIQAQVRRAVIVAGGAIAAGAVFVIAESALESAIQARLFPFVSNSWAAGALAALIAALVAIPVMRIVRRVAPGILPDESENKVHTRRLEIYRYSVEGAAADGFLDNEELKVLAHLRRSLGITQDEHSAIVADVRAALA